ncbi:MAG TPA: hypothetical protein VEL74_09395 [Thermoanaerobaculia bacterium]|nr:hypothetical protein [Thermoanaerobaculia bacterium]
MEDQPLGRLLRELPRERAGDRFTARVLEGLDGGRRPARRSGWALATAALLALLVSGVLVERRGLRQGEPAHSEAGEARQALEEIRDEHERLARELERLQSLSEGQGDAPGIVYLGGNERMDLVLDLGRMPEGTLPASYGSETF